MKRRPTQETLLRAPLVPITCAFIGGILLRVGGAGWLWLFGTLAAVAVGVLIYRAGSRWVGVFLLLGLWIGLGSVRAAVWQAHPEEQLIRCMTNTPRPVRLHGIVVTDPVELFEPQEDGPSICVVRLIDVRTAHGWRAFAGRLRVRLPALARVAEGDDVLLEGEWSCVPRASNPGQYDWRAALARQRIHGLLHVRSFDGVVTLHRYGRAPWDAAVGWVRRRWRQLLGTTFDAESAGLLRSLLLGDRVALDERLREAFVQTGTMHLLVVSGSNVALIALLLEWLCRLCGLPWRARLLVSACGLGGYCLLTGGQPPVVRATIMAWIVLGAFALDRVISWPNTLAAAALATVWVSPMQLLDPGFQLSFGAVASLLIFIPRWQPRLVRAMAWVHPAWLTRYLALSLSATVAVWIGLSPVLAWYFHLASLVSVLANLLIAPLMSGLVTIGTGMLMLGTVLESSMRWGRAVLALLLHATRGCVLACQRVPGGWWVVGQPSLWWLVGYYSLVTLTVLRLRCRLAPSAILLSWTAALVVWVWSGVAHHQEALRWLRVDVLDVGHGDCVVVRTPHGQRLVIDAGSREAGQARVVPFLRSCGVASIDGLVLTHPDEDHLGGAIPLLQHLQVRQLLTNGVWDDTMSARWVRDLVRRHHIPMTRLAAGMTIQGDPAVQIEVLHPPRGLVPGAQPASNDNSVVLKLTKGSVSILLCGDIEELGLPWLLRTAGGSLRSTVIKVPHHGSRLGEAGERFFAAVHPKVAILSVGRAHHLPSAETIQLLERTGATVYSTREQGAIQLMTDGMRLEIHAFLDRKEHSF